MSLDKAIQHGKEWRKPYFRAPAFDRSCRNHGSCDWHRGNRTLDTKRNATRAQIEAELCLDLIRPSCANWTPADGWDAFRGANPSWADDFWKVYTDERVIRAIERSSARL